MRQPHASQRIADFRRNWPDALNGSVVNTLDDVRFASKADNVEH
jgi:hypothetical protein